MITNDWSRLNAMTDDQVHAAARADPDARPMPGCGLTLHPEKTRIPRSPARSGVHFPPSYEVELHFEHCSLRAYIEAAGGKAILFSWLKTISTG